MARPAKTLAPPASKSPERIELEQLLAKLSLAPVSGELVETLSQLDVWSLDAGHFGHVAYLRERATFSWIRFTAQGLRSQRAVEVILRDCLKAMVQP